MVELPSLIGASSCLEEERDPRNVALNKLAAILTSAIFSALYELVTGKMAPGAAVDEENVDFASQGRHEQSWYDIHPTSVYSEIGIMQR